MNDLITKSLASGDVSLISMLPNSILTKTEIKWLKFVFEYVEKFGSTPSVERLANEYVDFVPVDCKDPLQDCFLQAIGKRRNTLVREFIVKNGDKIKDGQDPFIELECLMKSLNVPTVEIFNAESVELDLFTKKQETYFTGFGDIDEKSGGVSKGDLVYIFGRPGSGKCLGLGTKIVMFGGGYKNVEDIVVGDLLMGVDSTPRKVLSTTNGKEMMYWIHQKKGISYRVNRSHILSLKRDNNKKNQNYGDERQFVVGDVTNKPKRFFDTWKGWKSGVSFHESEVTIDPYFLGLWLGDVSTSNNVVCNEDAETDEWFNKFSIENGFAISTIGVDMQSALRKIGVLENKHIPDNYIFNTYELRMSLLAGLIDSCAHLSKVDKISYEITLKDEKLLMQVKQICDSLGFVTSVDFSGTYHRLSFGGNNLENIPVKIARKRAIKSENNSSWRLMPITIVEDIIDDYYGFELSGDGLFLLEDFTVTHNTTLLLNMVAKMSLEGKRCLVVSNEIRWEDILYKLYAQVAGVSVSAKRAGKLTDNDIQKLKVVKSIFNQLKTLSVVRRPIHKVSELIPLVNDIDILFIDGVYLMSPSGAASSDWKDLAEVSRALKQLSNSKNLTIVGVVQANRSATDGLKQLSVAGTDAFTQDSDLLLGVEEAGYIDGGGKQINVISSKNRNGLQITTTINVSFPVVDMWEAT